MDHLAGPLQAAADGEEAGAHDSAAMGLEAVAPDDDIGDAGFILEGQEDDALGGAGALPDQHEAGDGHLRVGTKTRIAVLRIGYDPEAPQSVAQEAHGMRLE